MSKLTRLGAWIRAAVRPAHDPERGASLVEYALLLALIAVVCIVAISAMGLSLNDSYTNNGSSLFPPP